jgi:hypothetical protein
MLRTAFKLALRHAEGLLTSVVEIRSFEIASVMISINLDCSERPCLFGTMKMTTALHDRLSWCLVLSWRSTC